MAYKACEAWPGLPFRVSVPLERPIAPSPTPPHQTGRDRFGYPAFRTAFTRWQMADVHNRPVQLIQPRPLEQGRRERPVSLAPALVLPPQEPDQLGVDALHKNVELKINSGFRLTKKAPDFAQRSACCSAGKDWWNCSSRSARRSRNRIGQREKPRPS